MASYIHAMKNGALKKRILEAKEALKNCHICPRNCYVNRYESYGLCQTGESAKIASYFPHRGEEKPLSGSGGSGTIFFSSCSLLCQFCQNEDVSHNREGEIKSPREIAEMMCELQEKGCHNINLVTPSHVVPTILESLYYAIDMGLTIPLVYNTSSYDNVETLKWLDGIIDIYLADIKFCEMNISQIACNAPDYPIIAKQAIKEMHRQVGDLILDNDGIAERGLMLRHLILPQKVVDINKIVQFVKDISKNTYLNLMTQYRPLYKAKQIKVLSTVPSMQDFRVAYEIALREGLTRVYQY